MKKIYGITLIASTVLLTGCGANLTNSTTNETTTSVAPVQTSQYRDYSEANLQQSLKNNNDTVLFVYNPSCGSCNILDQNISSESSKIPNDMGILKINYATQKDVMKKYNVDSYHTLIYLDKQGNETKRQKGNIFTVQDIVNMKSASVSQNSENTQYLAYSEKSLSDALAENKEVALFVHNRGCGSCNLLDSNLKAEQSQINKDMVILNVDYETQKDVMEKYNIDGYHTVVFLDREGNEVNRQKGDIFTLSDLVSYKPAISQQSSSENTYLAYNDTNLTNALENDKDVVLFVHNRGCGTCNLLDMNLNEQIGQKNNNLTILNIDYGKQKDVMKKYNVDSYHTLIYLDDAGNETSRIRGNVLTLEDVVNNKG